MSAVETTEEQGDIGQLELYYKAVGAGRPVIIVTKAPWYKELAGVIGALAWASMIGLFTYALAMPGRTVLEEWWYMIVLFAIAMACSGFREQSPRINMEREG